MTALHEQMQIVAAARRRRDDAMAYLAAVVDQWEATVGFPLRATVKSLVADCSEVEILLRDMTLAAYRETGSKHPAPGVDVRLVQQLDYDPAIAQLWGYEHGVCLRLDPRAFEKLAKAMPLDFVTITEVPVATIAGDLDKVLKDMGIEEAE